MRDYTLGSVFHPTSRVEEVLALLDKTPLDPVLRWMQDHSDSISLNWCLGIWECCWIATDNMTMYRGTSKHVRTSVRLALELYRDSNKVKEG